MTTGATLDHFADRLTARCRQRGNALCVGLDPRWDLLPEELRRCSQWLDGEISLLRNARVLLALGAVGWESSLLHFARRGFAVPRPRPRFAHGAVALVPGAPALLGSYHVSQQNTNTGKLTPAMLDEVLVRARELF